MNQHIPPTAWSDLQTVRELAGDIGIAPGQAMNDFIRSGYAQSYKNDLSERARQARMDRRNDGGEAA